MDFFRIILVVGLCLCFAQCKRAVDNTSTSDVVIVKIDELNKQVPSEAFTDVELIPLQTTTQSLVGQIKQISIKNEHIYICDVNQNIVVFGLDGAFAFKLSPGRGHGEYSSLTHCYVTTDNILVYDYLQSKMFVYDLNGRYIKRINSNSEVNSLITSSSEGEILPNGQLLLNLDFVPTIQNMYSIVGVKSLMRVETNLCKYPFVWEYRSSDGARPKIAQNSKGVYGLSIMSDTIYMIDDSCRQLTPRYILDSGKESIYNSGLSVENIDGFGSLLHLVASDDDYSWGIRSLLMTEKVGYASCIHNDETCHLFWNLDSGKVYVFPQYTGHDNILEDLNLLTATTDKFVGIVYPYQLSSDSKVRLSTGVMDDDNPIVVLYKNHYFDASSFVELK